MFISYTHESVRLTGRWKHYGDRAVATSAGSYIEFAFEGDMAVARFDVAINQMPYLHLWIQIDGGDMVEASVDRYIRIKTRNSGKHVCKMIFKSSVEQTGRWYAPLTGAVQFLGVQTEKPVRIEPDNRPIMEFIGDSITEGVLIDTDYCEGTQPAFEVDQLCRPYQDDSCATWAWLTSEKLGYRPLIMGYGAVGATRAGCGRVPAVFESYPYYFDGEPLDENLPQADVVVVNHGANDHGKDPELYKDGYRKLLDTVRRRSPHATVFAVSAFAGSQKDTLDELVKEYNLQNGCKVHFVNASEWIPPQPLHPHRDGHRIVAEHLVPVLTGILKSK